MPEVIDDTGAYPVMLELRDQAQAELERSGLAAAEYAYLQAGNVPVIDYAGNGGICGELIVNLVSGFPVGNFPAQDATAAKCSTQLGYLLNLALFRCAPNFTGPKQAPKPPTLAAQNDSARQALADMQAMRRAICKTMAVLEREYVLGGFQPYGPEGGVVGGVWSITVSGP